MSDEPILQFFAYAHLPAHLQERSKPFGDLAQHIVTTLPRNPERSVALRKLLEAKDAAVRAAVFRAEEIVASAGPQVVSVGVDFAPNWGVHDLQPGPSGKGRWCARCGLAEATCSIEGRTCQPLHAGARPYGGQKAGA